MKLEDLIKEQKKDKKFRIVYPKIIPRPKRKVSEKYLISKAILHLRKHFTTGEMSTLLRKSRKFIYRKLKELR